MADSKDLRNEARENEKQSEVDKEKADKLNQAADKKEEGEKLEKDAKK